VCGLLTPGEHSIDPAGRELEVEQPGRCQREIHEQSHTETTWRTVARDINSTRAAINPTRATLACTWAAGQGRSGSLGADNVTTRLCINMRPHTALFATHYTPTMPGTAHVRLRAQTVPPWRWKSGCGRGD